MSRSIIVPRQTPFRLRLLAPLVVAGAGFVALPPIMSASSAAGSPATPAATGQGVRTLVWQSPFTASTGQDEAAFVLKRVPAGDYLGTLSVGISGVKGTWVSCSLTDSAGDRRLLSALEPSSDRIATLATTRRIHLARQSTLVVSCTWAPTEQTVSSFPGQHLQVTLTEIDEVIARELTNPPS